MERHDDADEVTDEVTGREHSLIKATAKEGVYVQRDNT